MLSYVLLYGYEGSYHCRKMLSAMLSTIIDRMIALKKAFCSLCFHLSFNLLFIKVSKIIFIVDQNVTHEEQPIFRICEGYLVICRYLEVRGQPEQIRGVCALNVAFSFNNQEIIRAKVNRKYKEDINERWKNYFFTLLDIKLSYKKQNNASNSSLECVYSYAEIEGKILVDVNILV